MEKVVSLLTEEQQKKLMELACKLNMTLTEYLNAVID